MLESSRTRQQLGEDFSKNTYRSPWEQKVALEERTLAASEGFYDEALDKNLWPAELPTFRRLQKKGNYFSGRCNPIHSFVPSRLHPEV